MKIRHMHPINITHVIDVIQDAFQAPPWNMIMPEEEIHPRLNMFNPEDRHLLVAEQHQEIVGLVWFGIARPETLPPEIVAFLRTHPTHLPRVYVGAVAVKRAWQGHGIGRHLMTEIHRCTKEQYREYVLYSRMRSDNPRVIAIHQSFGFTRTGIYEDHYGVKDEWWHLLHR